MEIRWVMLIVFLCIFCVHKQTSAKSRFFLFITRQWTVQVYVELKYWLQQYNANVHLEGVNIIWYLFERAVEKVQILMWVIREEMWCWLLSEQGHSLGYISYIYLLLVLLAALMLEILYEFWENHGANSIFLFFLFSVLGTWCTIPVGKPL
jgi:hypothetical protein